MGVKLGASHLGPREEDIKSVWVQDADENICT
jgi:hypothetical protein